jgi:hypothetical protein
LTSGQTINPMMPAAVTRIGSTRVESPGIHLALHRVAAPTRRMTMFHGLYAVLKQKA